MNKEGLPEIPQLDAERVRSFISECARLYGAMNIRILKARGWQEADAKDIVQHAFRTMMKRDGEAYPESFATLLYETDFDPEHKRSRGFVRQVVTRSAIDAIRRKPDGPFSTGTNDKGDDDRSSGSDNVIGDDGGEALRNLSEQEKQFLARQMHFWFKSVCDRFGYDQHWGVYNHMIVGETNHEGVTATKAREETAALLNMEPKTVSNKATEGRLLRRVLGRLLMSLNEVPADGEPNNAAKARAMKAAVESLLLEGDELLTEQMKAVIVGLQSGEFSAGFGRNNRVSVKELRTEAPKATGSTSQQKIPRATLALAGMVLGTILHVTKHYTGASTHGEE
ncbi:hypothetical protein KBY31_21705 [Ruegeria pomeroyi]|nr:hypothetical protein [Ruegeria pomeroyi]